VGSDRFVKVVTHAGRVVCFSSRAAPGGERAAIGYSTLNPSPGNPNQDAAWSDFTFLSFPRELRPVGRSVITVDFGEEEIPTADVPFDVVSDGRYLSIFRQSANNTLYYDRFVLDEATGSVINAWEVRFRRSRKPDIPLDRRDTFGSTDMTGNRFLEPTIELDFVCDVNDGRFAVLILPTELAGVERWQILAQQSATGRLDSFSILRSPDGSFDLTDVIDADHRVLPERSFALTLDGASLPLQTGPGAVLYHQQEWLTDDSGEVSLQKLEARVMVAVGAGADGVVAILDFGVGVDGRLARVPAELPIAAGPAIGTGLVFARDQGTQVTIPAIAAVAGRLTIELWISPSEHSAEVDVLVESAAGVEVPFTLALRDGVPVFAGPGGATVAADGPIDPRVWTHVAGVWNGSPVVYVNGQPHAAPADPPTSAARPSDGYAVGGIEGFTGLIDELRLWSVARTGEQILATMCVGLSAATPGWEELAGYWKLDEPDDDRRFTTVINASHLGTAADGALAGPRWAASSAPVAPSMVPVAWDENGLSATTSLLSFAATGTAPALVEGGDSRVHMYFSDRATHALMAAQYSPVVARATSTVPWFAGDPEDPANDEAGVVSFVARQPGAPMNATALSPPFVVVAPAAEPLLHATVTLRGYTGYREEWPEVPLTLPGFAAVLNGDAAQTSGDPAELARGVLMYDYRKVVVTPAGGQLAPVPGPGLGSALFRVLPGVPASNGQSAHVEGTGESRASFGRAGTDPWWQAAPPLPDIDMSERGQFVRVLSEPKVADYKGPLLIDRDVAVEAWLRPSGGSAEDATVFVLNSPGKVGYLVGLDAEGHPVAANGDVVNVADAVVPRDGTWTHLAASYRTDFGLQLGGARYLNAGNDRSLDSPDAVTAEAWVRLDRLGARQTVIAKWDLGRGRSWELGVDAAGRIELTVAQSTATGLIERTARSRTALAIGAWHHVAGVYDVAFTREVALMFDLGSYVKIPAPAGEPTDGVTVAMWLKVVGSTRPGDEILFTSTDAGMALPVSLSLRDGIPRFSVWDGAQHTIVAAEPLRADDWLHIAGSYQRGRPIALTIDGVPTGSPTTAAGRQTADRPAADEAAEDRPATGATAAPIAYSVGGQATEKSFTGTINELSLWNRGLSLEEVRQKIQQPLATTERGLAGYWRFNDLYGTTAMDLAGTANGEIVGANFIRVDKGAFAQKVFVDGRMEAFDRALDPIVMSDTAVTIGSGHFASYLQGAVGELRLWNVGRMNWQVEYFRSRDLEPNPRGLIALWPLETGSGGVAFDAKGEANAVIRDGEVDLTAEAIDRMWIRTTFKAAWTFFVNGTEVVSRPGTLTRSGLGDAQATIAALRYQEATTRFYTGEIAELRVWSHQLIGDQVRGGMFVALAGAEPGLAGYWPFDDGSGNVIGDRSGGGANGRWIGSTDAPRWQLATIPVGSEAPQIRSVPGRIPTAWSASGRWAAGMGSYGQLQQDARGELTAVLKLAYGYVDAVDDALRLTSGFAIGGLVLQYVGQAQLRPTLIGYIEGPPPVPAENLKLYPGSPDSYAAASTLSLDEAGSQVLSYTASRDVGEDTSASTSFGFNIEQSTAAGIGVSQKIFGLSANVGLQVSADETLGTLGEAQVSEDLLVSAKKSVEVRGRWLPNTYAIDEGVGELFYPSNLGYALVRSGTADVFATRLRGTGTLVGYSTHPNPDIPEDVNILTFKIRDGYVKNGTLDGWIGFEPDTSYEFLTPGERGSYFKPLEAYALKRLAEREAQQRKTWFEHFDAVGLGRREKAGRPGSVDIADGARSLGNVLMGLDAKAAISREEWKARMARRNMVNTYVWTAAGGFYAEEQQFVAVREESSGGSYSMTTQAGIVSEFSLNIGPSFSLSALFGSHIITQAMKTDREQWQYAMDVTAFGERYIGRLEDHDGEIVYTNAPSAGKVQAYRFMSFYLAPARRNFEDFLQVVDEDWLRGMGPYAGTYDPDALALRQALTNPNEVWRVLHRVTYVSRVPPQAENEGESLAGTVRRPDPLSVIENRLLIASLPADLRASRPLRQVSVEADALLGALAENPVWGQLLVAHEAEVKDDIMTYMAAYYAVPAPQ